MPFEPAPQDTRLSITPKQAADAIRRGIEEYPIQAKGWVYTVPGSACALACLEYGISGKEPKCLDNDLTHPLVNAVFRRYMSVLFANICRDNNEGDTREEIADRIESLPMERIYA